MKKILLSLLIISILCIFFITPPIFSNEIFVKVENNSRSDIENIKIYVSSSIEESKRLKIDVSDTLYYRKLKSKDSFKYFQNMKNITADGSYIIEFERESGKVETIKHGYYSNGAPSDKGIRYSIENDTIIVYQRHLLFYKRVSIK